MFAPRVAPPQTKETESSTGKFGPRHSALEGHRPGRDPVKQASFLQRTIGNEATPGLLARRGASLTGVEFRGQDEQETDPTSCMRPGLSWDFSKIPVFPADRAEHPSLPRPSSAGILAAAEGIRQATVENRSAVPPTTADFVAAIAQVRMRHDASADRSTRLLGAEAVAFGNQILFRSGRYEPQSERGRSLIAHELTHVVHQRQTGRYRPQRVVSADVLSVQITRAMAEAMTDEELSQQMNILRSHLQETPGDTAAAENLSVLESLAYDRQGTRSRSSRSKAAPRQPAADEAIARLSATDKLIKAYEYADIGTELRSQLEQRFGPKQLVIMIGAGIGVFIAAQFTPVGWIADIGMVLTAAFIGKILFDAFHHLAGFAAAANATTDGQLHQAGDEFAKAVAGLEIDTVMLILTLLSGGAGGAAGRAASSASAPAGDLALVGADGVIVGTIRAAKAAETATAITTAQAAQLGFKGAVLANAMMSKGAGPQTTSEAAEDLGRTGGGTNPREAATVGTEIEPIEVQDWAAELNSKGFQTYTRRQFTQGKIGGRPLNSMFTDRRAVPDLIAVNEADKTAIVGDVTGNPGSTAAIPGRVGQEEGLHIEKTIEYAKQLKRQLGAGYRVFAQDRHWQTGTLTKLIEVF